jgi:hypothetical protein
MDVFSCWLCCECPDPEKATRCSSIAKFTHQTVSQLVIKFGLVHGDEDDDFQNYVVCDACMELVAKLDCCAFELDSCLNVLRKRIVNGKANDPSIPFSIYYALSS